MFYSPNLKLLDKILKVTSMVVFMYLGPTILKTWWDLHGSKQSKNFHFMLPFGAGKDTSNYKKKLDCVLMVRLGWY